MGKEGGGRGSSIGVASRGLARPSTGLGRGLSPSARSSGISPGLHINKTISGESGGSFLKSSDIFSMPKISIGRVDTFDRVPGNLVFKNTVTLATGEPKIPKVVGVKVSGAKEPFVGSEIPPKQKSLRRGIKRTAKAISEPSVLYIRRSGISLEASQRFRLKREISKPRVSEIPDVRFSSPKAEKSISKKTGESNVLKRLEAAVENFRSTPIKTGSIEVRDQTVPQAFGRLKVEPFPTQNSFSSPLAQKILHAYAAVCPVTKSGGISPLTQSVFVPRVVEARIPSQEEIKRVGTEIKATSKAVILKKHLAPQTIVEIKREVEEAVLVYTAASAAGIAKPELVAVRALQQSLKTKGLEKELILKEEEQVLINEREQSASVKSELIPPKLEENKKTNDYQKLIPVVDEKAQNARTEISGQVEGDIIQEGQPKIPGEVLAQKFAARKNSSTKCELAGDGTDGSFETIVFELSKEGEVAVEDAELVIKAKIKKYPGVKMIEEGQSGEEVGQEDAERLRSKIQGIRPTT